MTAPVPVRVRRRAIRGLVIQGLGGLSFVAVAVYFAIERRFTAAAVFGLLALLPFGVAAFWVHVLRGRLGSSTKPS